MKKYAYSECGNFENKLVEAVHANRFVTEMVIETECNIRIRHSWHSAINYYPASQLADVLALSAEKSIISSNSNYYILHKDYIECADDLMSIYGYNFDQTIYDIWGTGEANLLESLCGVVNGDTWRVCYIDNEPSDLDEKIISRLVASKEHDLLDELANERAWAIYWD